MEKDKINKSFTAKIDFDRKYKHYVIDEFKIDYGIEKLPMVKGPTKIYTDGSRIEDRTRGAFVVFGVNNVEVRY